MLLKYFYDSALAHASYLVGCQKTGEAIVIDPGRAIQSYIDATNKNGMRIVGVAETHIHADYVSGARELAARGARLYVSDEGPPEWKYSYARDYDAQLLKEGDRFRIGMVQFEVMFTPGHTPESISFLLTDVGGGASQPMGMFTGDFVFVGSIGRPDLLEEAAGLVGTAQSGAKQLFESAQRFNQLPDFLQIWPAHGAGSACGKGLGAIPSSTVGYEKRFNPALQFDDQLMFVDYILAEQPEAPTYFRLMKQVNKEGPDLIGDRGLPERLKANLAVSTAASHMVIDTRESGTFARAHVPRTVNIPLIYLAAWAGWLVDYEQPVYLLIDEPDLSEAVRIMREIGIDKIGGYFDAAEVNEQRLMAESYQEATPKEIAPELKKNEIMLIDVRGDTEWREKHIEQAQRCFLARLPELIKNFSGDCKLVFQCRSGGRSAIAASIAQAAGVPHVINLKGGINAWIEAGLPVVNESAGVYGPNETASVNEMANQSQAIFWNAECPPREQSRASGGATSS